MFWSEAMCPWNARTNSQRVWLRPESGAARMEHELADESDRSLSSVTDPGARLRLMCLKHGAAGIMGLGRIFHHMDDDNCRLISKEEFVRGIKDDGLDLGEEDSIELFETFDIDNTGFINIDEFMKYIRPPMSESRRSIVKAAFHKLDRTGDGLVTVDDIRQVYSVLANPRYTSGEETKERIINKFLAHFEQKGIVDGVLTLDDFMSYYSGISASIDTDCYFDLMMRQDYKL